MPDHDSLGFVYVPVGLIKGINHNAMRGIEKPRSPVSHRARIKRRAFSLSALAVTRRDNFGRSSTDVLLPADFSL